MTPRVHVTWAMLTVCTGLSGCYEDVLCDLHTRAFRIELEGIEVDEVDELIVTQNGQVHEVTCVASERPGVTRCPLPFTAEDERPLRLTLRTTDGFELHGDIVLERGQCGAEPDPLRVNVPADR